MNCSPIQKAFLALNPIDRTEALALAIRRGGRQYLHLVKKHDAGIAMDCRWLANPDGHGETQSYLAGLEKIDCPIEPVGYGLVTVDFDARKIVSAQSYRSLEMFTADEFGHHAHCGPHWMNWLTVIKAAFEHGAVDAVRYDHQAKVFTDHIVRLEGPARSNWTLALRTATALKPYGFGFRGIDFRPPLWQVETVGMVPGNSGLVGDRAFARLIRNGWDCATRATWCGHSFC